MASIAPPFRSIDKDSSSEVPSHAEPGIALLDGNTGLMLRRTTTRVIPSTSHGSPARALHRCRQPVAEVKTTAPHSSPQRVNIPCTPCFSCQPRWSVPRAKEWPTSSGVHVARARLSTAMQTREAAKAAEASVTGSSRSGLGGGTLDAPSSQQLPGNIKNFLLTGASSYRVTIVTSTDAPPVSTHP